MGLRLLFYCHDTFGLGHFRRTLSLAKHFTATLPGAEALIVTGSPLAYAFELPPHVDYIKLPAVTKRSDGTYAAQSLTLEFAAMRDLRAVLLRETAQAYHPDVFLVDHAPLGLKRESLPTLTFLRTTHPTCLCVLGLRDILENTTTFNGHSQHKADQARLHIHPGDHIREGRGNICQIHHQGLAVKKE